MGHQMSSKFQNTVLFTVIKQGKTRASGYGGEEELRISGQNIDSCSLDEIGP